MFWCTSIELQEGALQSPPPPPQYYESVVGNTQRGSKPFQRCILNSWIDTGAAEAMKIGLRQAVYKKDFLSKPFNYWKITRNKAKRNSRASSWLRPILTVLTLYILKKRKYFMKFQMRFHKDFGSIVQCNWNLGHFPNLHCMSPNQ